MFASNAFVPGDLVLVKFPVYGYWPSKIISQKVSTADYKTGWRKIICFGDIKGIEAYDENIKDMKPYDEKNKTKFISKKSLQKYPELAKGLKQISMEYQERNNGTKEKKKQSKAISGKKKQDKAKNIIKPKHNEMMEEEEPNNEQEDATKTSIEESCKNNLVEEGENSLTNSEKASESNMEQSSEEPNNIDGEFNFKIKVENDITDITVDETQWQEQMGVVVDDQPSSSQTIRNEKSSSNQPNCTSAQEPCGRNIDENVDYSNAQETSGGRNTEDNVKISMTIQMSEATFVRIAPLLPDTVQVQYHVNASSNTPQQ